MSKDSLSPPSIIPPCGPQWTMPPSSPPKVPHVLPRRVIVMNEIEAVAIQNKKRPVAAMKRPRWLVLPGLLIFSRLLWPIPPLQHFTIQRHLLHRVRFQISDVEHLFCSLLHQRQTMRSWIICSPLVQELPCLVINQDIVADLIGEKNNMPRSPLSQFRDSYSPESLSPTLPSREQADIENLPAPNRGVFAERIPGKPATTPAMLADFKK